MKDEKLNVGEFVKEEKCPKPVRIYITGRYACL